MSGIVVGRTGLGTANRKVPQEPNDEEFHQLVREKFMQDARRDAIIDVFIEKCNQGVTGSCTFDIARSSTYQNRSTLSDDDAAFIRELKAELVTDLCCAGLHSAQDCEAEGTDLYDKIQPQVARRMVIWDALEPEYDDDVPVYANFLEPAIRLGKKLTPSAYDELQSLRDGGAPQLQQITEQRGLELLSSAVKGEQASATFACGGSIKIRAANNNASTNEDGQLLSPPVVLRWDNIEKTVTRRVELPYPPGQGYGLDMLVKDCQPATFGLGGVDVLDESYRKASKLDNTQFSTNFNPYDYGIVDTIAQILFPSVDEYSCRDLGLELRGVRAELYKLNIYSGPSGMFHPHVDTPRGEGQFGSLVVCLPSAHSGGELLVRHEGTTVTFDWGTTSASSCCIQWAAFYSDCEHEVLEVTSGHRLTLTYNLYIREHDYLRENQSRVLGRTLTMAPEQLPLYAMVRDLLDQPGFLRDGAVLGFFCSHEYAHTHGCPPGRVPRSLKGVDMAIYAVFRALGLRIEILPVLGLPGRSSRDRLKFGGLNLNYSGRQPSFLRMLERSKSHLYSGRSGHSAPKPTVDDVRLYYKGYDSDEEVDDEGNPEVTDHEDYKDVHTRLQTILRTRQIEGISTAPDPVIAGTKLHERIEDMSRDMNDTKLEVRNEDWPNVNLPRVQWLNEPKHTESALTHMAYGNEAELVAYYSAAALLVIVPPSSERGPFPICRASKRQHSEDTPATQGTTPQA